MDSDPLLKVKQIAEKLSLSDGEVRQIIAAGLLPSIRVGRRNGGIRVFSSDVAAYIEQRKNPTATRSPRRSSVKPRSSFTKPAPRVYEHLEALGFGAGGK